MYRVNSSTKYLSFININILSISILIDKILIIDGGKILCVFSLGRSIQKTFDLYIRRIEIPVLYIFNGICLKKIKTNKNLNKILNSF